MTWARTTSETPASSSPYWAPAGSQTVLTEPSLEGSCHQKRPFEIPTYCRVNFAGVYVGMYCSQELLKWEFNSYEQCLAIPFIYVLLLLISNHKILLENLLKKSRKVPGKSVFTSLAVTTCLSEFLVTSTDLSGFVKTPLGEKKKTKHKQKTKGTITWDISERLSK